MRKLVGARQQGNIVAEKGGRRRKPKIRCSGLLPARKNGNIDPYPARDTGLAEMAGSSGRGIGREASLLELYHHGTSVCAAKPRILLAEKGLEWTNHYVDILKNEQFAPAYLALNPKAVVPTLVHDGHVIRESTLIGEYIDEVFPDPPMKPDNALDRHVMRSWGKRIDEEVFPVTGILTFAISHRHAILALPPDAVENYVNALGPGEASQRRKRLTTGVEDSDAVASLHVFDKFFADMEAALARGPWLAGDRFSLAEVNVIPFVNRLDMLALSGMWTQSRPHLAAWWQRLKARPMFEDAMFKYVPPPLQALMTAKGREAWPKVRSILGNT